MKAIDYAEFKKLNARIYPTRYYANQIRKKGQEVVIKVENGYAIISIEEYIKLKFKGETKNEN